MQTCSPQPIRDTVVRTATTRSEFDAQRPGRTDAACRNFNRHVVFAILTGIVASHCQQLAIATAEASPPSLAVMTAAAGRGDPSLRESLLREAGLALDQRQMRFEQLVTAEQIRRYQLRLKASFLQSLGSFPDRTPLGTRLVGTVAGDGYRIEKVLYESRPGFLVTALVYVPQGQGPFPAILLPCGHSEQGKAEPLYQRACMLLAKHGFVVLCYDPIGQGERKQILRTESDGRQRPEGRFRATSEHMLSGVAPILLGESLATYRIWDGMRGLDYLASRPDVDAGRLGCTGNSGGGLMTSYLMALDPRIAAAAPSCFVTTTRRKNVRPGPGDAEQNIFGQLKYGLDHPDFLILHAPSPALICAATQDFLSIEGTWEAFRQAKRVYGRLGAAERIDLIEADRQHGFTRPLRVGAARFFRRWLLDEDEPIDEEPTAVFDPRELQCTPAGQVLLMDGARSVFELNQATAKRLAARRTSTWKQRSPTEQIAEVRRRASVRSPEQIRLAAVERYGQIERDRYTIEKLILRPGDRFPLPALLFVPDQPQGNPVLYLHGDGKHVDAGAEGPIAELARQGRRVLAVDLRGHGETAMAAWRYSQMAPYVGRNAAEFFLAYMLGRSLVGMRAEDILVSARYLSPLDPPKAIDLWAVGSATIPGLHAAAVEPQRFDKLRLVRSLDAWQRVIDTPVTVDQLENTVHGALRSYELSDLIDLVGKSSVLFDCPVDAAGHCLGAR